jgi:UDP-N-acetylmuramoyl-L-alanyl-D-glutamate--2,6-diaminopimelate ligase
MFRRKTSLRLTELIKAYKGDVDPEIKALCVDSRQVKSGCLFAALPGSKYNGLSFLKDALDNGAVAVIIPDGAGIDFDISVPVISSADPRKMVAELAARFYGAQPETVCAVTGTNGKTSTVHFTQQLWNSLGLKSASLGTLGVRGAGMVRSGSLTTPDSIALSAELADLAAAGVTHLAMEASSHGLDQRRLDGIHIKAAGFTNLSRDHLDYHLDMDQYLEAKKRLFTELLERDGAAVINADCEYGQKIIASLEEAPVRLLTYGQGGHEIKIISSEAEPAGQRVNLDIFGKSYDVFVPLVGQFQIMNVLCALGLVSSQYIDKQDKIERLIEAVATLSGAPGRLQLVSGHPRGAAIYIDYAHTPNALENVLIALRAHTRGKLYCVAGCGGDRDRGKRPLMGQIMADLADVGIVTDDNPRSEAPSDIRSEMIADRNELIEISGRKKAIEEAVKMLEDGDVLVIAGKGHEQGQIIGEVIEPFDDFEEAQSAIKGAVK